MVLLEGLMAIDTGVALVTVRLAEIFWVPLCATQAGRLQVAVTVTVVVVNNESACTKPLVGTLLLIVAEPVGAIVQVSS